MSHLEKHCGLFRAKTFNSPDQFTLEWLDPRGTVKQWNHLPYVFSIEDAHDLKHVIDRLIANSAS